MNSYYRLLLILCAFSFSTLEAQQNSYKKYYKKFKKIANKYDGNYSNLDTITSYSGWSSYQFINNEPIYRVDNKIVTKDIYEKFEENHKKIKDCKPCILKLYDIDETLLSEMVAYNTIAIDWKKTYYKNKNIKSIEQFYFSDSIFENGALFVSPLVKHGEFKFYDTLGNYSYSDFWNKDVFVKQVPEQSFNEVISAKILLNKNELKNNTLISYADLNQLSFDLTKKNNAIDTSKLYLEVFLGLKKRVHFNNYFTGININDFPIDSLKYIDFKEKVRQSNKFLSTDSIYCNIRLYNTQKHLGYKSITIKNELIASDDSTTSYKKEQIEREHSNATKTNQLAFRLINSNDSSRVIRIKDATNIEITYEELVNDSLIQEKSNISSGELLAITDTTVSFRVYQESVYTKFKNGNNIDQENTYYNNDNSIINPVNRTINKNQIEYFQYNNKARNGIQIGGSTLTIVSVGTALLVAPLVGINFKNGNFDKEKYYTVAGCGLAGIAVGIPLIIIGQQKNYSITTRSKAKKSDAWYISE